MRRLSSCSQATIALAAIAIVMGGCAGANNTASSQGEQSYKTMYGLSSEGPTTDLYTELFGPRKPAAPPETATAVAQPAQLTANASQPVQGAIAPAPAQPPAQAATATTRQTKQAAASATSRQVQPAPAPVEVPQQPPAPQPPPQPDVPVAYGITANGPTTDLYTELFGPRRRDGQ